MHMYTYKIEIKLGFFSVFGCPMMLQLWEIEVSNVWAINTKWSKSVCFVGLS